MCSQADDPSAHDIHNLAACDSRLPLSEVAEQLSLWGVGAGGRLTDTVPRYLRLIKGGRRRRAYPAETIARRIAEDGSVWGAIVAYGISYSHACRIRAGWRPR